MTVVKKDISERIAEKLNDATLKVVLQNQSQTKFVEAVGMTVDADDDQWRKLTGDSNRDLSAMTHKRMQKTALYLWQSNLMANRLIELPVAYLLAEGVELRCKDKEAQRWLNAFWGDPINNMKRKLKKKVRELLLFGEQAWPAFVNDRNGHVRIGYLDPELIAVVVMDPDNAEQPIGIVTTKDKHGNARRFKVIVNGEESDLFTERTQQIRAGFDDGELFFNRINELSNGTRGRSQLLAQIDWLDAYDQYLFGELDRSQFLRAFYYDITMVGATEEQVKQRARSFVPPKPGSARIHNDAEIHSAVSPALNANDTSETARLFRNQILGGATYPEHWFGGGGDVNRSTADSMGEPTFKMLSSLQQDLGSMLRDIGIFVLNRKMDPTGETVFIDPYNPDPDFLVEAVWPELTATDTTKYAAALQQVTAAAVLSVNEGLITKQLALRQIASISARLGVDFDADAEFKQVAIQVSEDISDDIYSDQPERDI